MPAVVFDWDGTLVDTLPAIFRANIATLERYGVPFDEATYRAAFAPDWRVMYRRLGIGEADLEAAGHHWRERFEASDGLVPFPGARDALARLAAAGHALGIVTAGHRRIVETQLAEFGMAAFIGAMVCGDDPGIPAKPDPTPLRMVLRELGHLDGGDRPTPGSFYVGDVPDDMRLARAVGVEGVGVVNLLGTADELAAAGAGRVVTSVAEWVDAWLGAGTLP